MIDKFTVSFETLGFKSLSMNSDVLRLHGDIRVCNSMLAALEKCISEDLSPYVDSRDKEFGISTDIVRSCALSSSFADVSINVDSTASSYKNDGSYYRVVRSLNSTVRVTETPVAGGLDNASDERKKTWEFAKKSYTTYSEALSIPDWVRLSKYVNNFAGNEVVSFDSATHELVINKVLMTPSIEIVYMLMYEAFFKVPDNCHKIFLLSDLSYIKSQLVDALISTIKTGKGVDSILYIRESSSVADSKFMLDSNLEF